MDKVAVITGASRGIGKECAMGFARLGYQTILLSRDEGKLKMLVSEIMNLDNEKIIPLVLVFSY